MLGFLKEVISWLEKRTRFLKVPLAILIKKEAITIIRSQVIWALKLTAQRKKHYWSVLPSGSTMRKFKLLIH